jgi:heat shock protein HslJ
MRRLFGSATIGLIIALSGCTTMPPERDMLSGTSWRLVEIQLMDDSQGVTRPGNGDRYRLQFNSDQTAYLKLDCNNARATWQATPSGSASGELVFRPTASTSALCGDNSLGETLGRQLGFVRSYTFRDGRLNLSLMADGGILVWEPAPPI